MKLNPDCIRSVMLEIEKLHAISVDDENNVSIELLLFDALYEALPKYSKEDVFYALFNLEQAGYIDASYQYGDGGITMGVVNYMTYAGHEFLEKIRDSKRWTIVKSCIEAVRDYSLDAIEAVAHGVAGAAIEEFLKKQGL